MENIMSHVIRKSLISVLTAALGAAALPVSAQQAADYPNRPIRLVVSAAPGGSSDGAARVIAQRLTELWKQQVIVDNRGGAGGVIGAGLVAKSEPDGYTIGIVSLRFSVNPSLLKIPFDPLKDFEFLTMNGAVGNVLVVNVKSPLTSVKELIAQAKERPGQLTFASSGIGGAPHLAGEFFAQQTGIKLTHIPYKGGGPAVADLVANNVSMSFASMTSALPHIQSNRLRPLAVTAKSRSRQLPNVPTMKEAGAGDLYVLDWQGMLTTAGTPKPVVAKLSTTIREVLKEPETVRRFEAMGLDVMATSGEEFRQLVASDIKRWARVVKEANIKAD
jgi:tripartite-type tricarboxylate transporter receptor subunit TctC